MGVLKRNGKQFIYLMVNEFMYFIFCNYLTLNLIIRNNIISEFRCRVL